MIKKPLLINVYGASGTGKSILASTFANALKLKGINAEYCREWIKEPILGGLNTDDVNQWHITAEQTQLLSNYLKSGCDVVITDSPVLTGKMYGLINKASKPDMSWTHWNEQCQRFLEKHDNLVGEGNSLNILLTHDPEVKFQTFGREQTQKESHLMQVKLKGILKYEGKIFTEAYLRDFIGFRYETPLNVLKAILRDSRSIDNHMKEVICEIK